MAPRSTPVGVAGAGAMGTQAETVLLGRTHTASMQ